jgi:hypothetical protein
MNGWQALTRALVPARPQAFSNLSLDEMLQTLSLENAIFPNLAGLKANVEDPSVSFAGLTTAIFSRSPIAFAALMARWKVFSQARFQWQQMFGGRQGTLFGSPALAVLEHPEPGETTVDLALRAISDADLEGDWFGALREVGRTRRLKRLRPDWTAVVIGSRNPDVDPAVIGLDPDAEVIGYGYQPGGAASGNDVVAFGPEEVAHFHPNINPLSRYRGMPLIMSALHEIQADQAATQHKLAFFKNGATAAVAISMPEGWDSEKAKKWIDAFEKKNTGALRAYRTIYFNAGMKAETVGSNFQQMTFDALQGKAETRLAAITGMLPSVVGFSEGLQGSSLNAGNFTAAARATADVTLRFLWANFCGSLETIITAPGGSRLWYDEGSIPFLQADVQDKADVLQKNGQTITNFVQQGFTPDSAVDAVVSGDYTRLVHTGLPSVQLQPATALPSDQGSAALAEPLVTVAQVLSKRAELEASGQSAGYDSLARELNVSPTTIRRRLGVAD